MGGELLMGSRLCLVRLGSSGTRLLLRRSRYMNGRILPLDCLQASFRYRPARLAVLYKPKALGRSEQNKALPLPGSDQADIHRLPSSYRNPFRSSTQGNRWISAWSDPGSGRALFCRKRSRAERIYNPAGRTGLYRKLARRQPCCKMWPVI